MCRSIVSLRIVNQVEDVSNRENEVIALLVNKHFNNLLDVKGSVTNSYSFQEPFDPICI